MAPSRGLTTLLRARNFDSRTRHFTRHYSEFVKAATNPANNSQIYVSRTSDPYLNLSIEHFLLQKTPPESTILFLYTNRPCVIIGRNQNPWIEVNLGLLKAKGSSEDSGLQDVSLVRRRSGGGTVFHDEGNVNYSVICPTSAFDRDRHAEMVVRALHRLGVDRAKVNERHDIVLRPESLEGGNVKPLKISGSAYKLTRLRSVHHGTCLLSSPNIKDISQYLRSPAKPYIKARGVDSVSSPIANANVRNADFEEAVISEFGDMYGSKEANSLGESLKDVPEIAKGHRELKSLEWIYSQTPQFNFSSYKTEDDPRERVLPKDLPLNFKASFTARNGTIGNFELSFVAEDNKDKDHLVLLDNNNLDKQLHEISDWASYLQSLSPNTWNDQMQSVAGWLNGLFGGRR